MKKTFYAFLLLFCAVNLSQAQVGTYTSTQNGNWTSPSTWGNLILVPLPGDIVIINHTVDLDIMDLMMPTGSITINSTGSLVCTTSPISRITFAGGGLNNSGHLGIAQVLIMDGTCTNAGTIQADSLLIMGSFSNNSSGNINANKLINDMGGYLSNNGTINSQLKMNNGTILNNGTVNTDNLLNSYSYTNQSNGIINVAVDFSNADLLATPAIFTNNGMVTINNDFLNSNEVNGSGRFCVQNMSTNMGVMNGTFDFCDMTGGNIDLNLGTVAPTITYCLYSCVTGFVEDMIENMITLHPNPNNGNFSISIPSGYDRIEILSSLGQKIYEAPILSETTDIMLQHQTARGIYFYKIISNSGMYKIGKFIIR